MIHILFTCKPILSVALEDYFTNVYLKQADIYTYYFNVQGTGKTVAMSEIMLILQSSYYKYRF